MAWATPSSRATGFLVTATVWNQDAVDNPIALRGGGIAIASQAQHDMIVATSATAFGRIANGTTGQRWEATTSGSPAWKTVVRCSAYHNTTQAVNDSGGALALNSEDFDTGTMHDTSSSTSRIVVPETGVYLVLGRTGTLSGNMNSGSVAIRVDGTTEYARTYVGANDNTANVEVARLMPLTASSYVELFARANGGSMTCGSASRELSTELQVILMVRT